MRRDIELCRSILLAVDASEKRAPHLSDIKVATGDDKPEYHIWLLIDAGFIAVEPPGDYFRLTWNGADIVEQLRDEQKWSDALTSVRTRELPETFGVIFGAMNPPRAAPS